MTTNTSHADLISCYIPEGFRQNHAEAMASYLSGKSDAFDTSARMADEAIAWAVESGSDVASSDRDILRAQIERQLEKSWARDVVNA